MKNLKNLEISGIVTPTEMVDVYNQLETTTESSFDEAVRTMEALCVISEKSGALLQRIKEEEVSRYDQRRT